LELADTSAWIWTRRTGGTLREQFDEKLLEGEIATCDMVRLELLYSTRNAAEFQTLRHDLDTLPDCPIGKDQWHRALDVYQQLSQQGGLHHRAVRYPDLLIAAAAEATNTTLLHYDEDYDRISTVSGQPTRWLAPRGTLS
jgi:predicted nucleic acid-binding protein